MDVTKLQRRRRMIAALLVPMAFHAAYDFALIQLSGVTMYLVVSCGSLALWAFVLRRVHRAQSASPFKQGG
jgi:hypothetical protein